MRVSLLICLVLISPLASAVDKNPPTKVRVGSQCTDDEVGQNVVLGVKELIRKSVSFELVEDGSQSMSLVVICASPEERDRGRHSSMAYVVTANNSLGPFDFVVSAGHVGCGTHSVDGCASDLGGGSEARP